ncbi:hypothetical protein Glove_113g50 [Diversispora epigaea]|uniref:Ribosomal protein S21 n=1 Tax=Diversispora epigaea TaxID=1348612 RepID=A0A397JAG4_9GLOM|nr:hypothetical protein Glove_113g50 [Diversispora epigaea]
MLSLPLIKNFKTITRPILNSLAGKFTNNAFTTPLPSLFLVTNTRHKHSHTQISTPFHSPPYATYSPELPISKPEEGNRSPTAGRTVTVSGNPTASYRRLWAILNSNKIRKEVRRNRYYEKPTAKRKRIRWEIAEVRFKEAVRKKVWLVLQMKNRGL